MISDTLIAKGSLMCALLFQIVMPDDLHGFDIIKNLGAMGFLAVALRYAILEIKRMREAHEKDKEIWEKSKEKELDKLDERHQKELDRVHDMYKPFIVLPKTD